MSKRVFKPGTLLMTIGLLLMAAALVFACFNEIESRKAGETAKVILEELTVPETVVDAKPVIHKTMEEKTEPVPDMAVEEINGYDYIGVLEVPSYDLSLPVMAQWDMNRLQISPCVYTGSYFTGDLVICAHNFSTHFNMLLSIALGEDIYLTTVDGYRYHYRVDNVETVQPMDIEQMITPTDWELTLFTCRLGGQTRCAVRCYMVE